MIFSKLYKDFRKLSEEQKLEAKMSLMKAIYTVKHNCGQIPPESPVQYAASCGTGVPQDVTFVTMSPSKFQELCNTFQMCDLRVTRDKVEHTFWWGCGRCVVLAVFIVFLFVNLLCQPLHVTSFVCQ